MRGRRGGGRGRGAWGGWTGRTVWSAFHLLIGSAIVDEVVLEDGVEGGGGEAEERQEDTEEGKNGHPRRVGGSTTRGRDEEREIYTRLRERDVRDGDGTGVVE